MSIFIGFNALIGAGAFACISLGGLSPQRIVPMTAILAAINIYTFARRFSAAKREASFPALGQNAQEQDLTAPNPGITFLRIVTFATMCVGVLIIVNFAMEAHMGVLNPDDVRTFVPRAAFGFALAIYVLHKTKKRPRT